MSENRIEQVTGILDTILTEVQNYPNTFELTINQIAQQIDALYQPVVPSELLTDELLVYIQDTLRQYGHYVIGEARGYERFSDAIDFNTAVDGIVAKLQPIIDQQKQDNLKLRELLWSTHPCQGKYGDDGELQCNATTCLIDFKRDTVQEIENKLTCKTMKELSEIERLKEQVKELEVQTQSCGDCDKNIRADERTKTLKEVGEWLYGCFTGEQYSGRCHFNFNHKFWVMLKKGQMPPEVSYGEVIKHGKLESK